MIMYDELAPAFSVLEDEVKEVYKDSELRKGIILGLMMAQDMVKSLEDCPEVDCEYEQHLYKISRVIEKKRMMEEVAHLCAESVLDMSDGEDSQEVLNSLIKKLKKLSS